MLYERLESLEKSTDFGLNKRPLGYGDFKRICKKYQIFVQEKPLLSELKGIFTWYGENPYICISSRLPERERTFIAFCELGHFFLHDRSNHFFTKMQDKWQLGEMEYHTRVFAQLAIVPTPDLIEIFNKRREARKPMNFRYLSELTELYHTTFQIMDSRLRIFYDYIFTRPDVLGHKESLLA
ncbi:MAG: ImmA/IrrE family metallo-endopeptidase [Candidatus Abyssobacteria bacterium SURF_5]|uniref:ImmA/IrrE family metallo-endopeptidase n=1 Tax=Abyssobacteria bacterium (strain SURF_5) TaxID=2093360 RepID=A0A3A4NV80_ABYX5|nr:MAG: ImmA/IrrE family metallo-endopeptidase [Candidatus Abyssubacteria bacterium SURF_5]